MKVYDLYGNISIQNWPPNGHEVTNDNKSDLHIACRNLLKELYIGRRILEEVPISITPGQTLFLDFYVPHVNTAIEVHGQQHFQFIPYFHINKLNFAKHKKNDKCKSEWCSLNNITLIELLHNENIKIWKKKIITLKND